MEQVNEMKNYSHVPIHMLLNYRATDFQNPKIILQHINMSTFVLKYEYLSSEVSHWSWL